MLFLLACSDSSITKNNASPEAAISAPAEGAVVREGAEVELAGVAGDADDASATLSATWYAGDSVLCAAAAPADDGTTTCTWGADPATPTLSLEVRDPSGGVATDTLTLVVEPNGAPSASIQSPADGTRWYSDQLLTLVGTVADDTDDPLAVTWGSSEDGELAAPTPDADGSVTSAVYLSEGQHLLTLAAEDLGGARGSSSIQLDVRGPNTPPTCGIDEPAEGAVVELGTTVLLHGVVGDPDEPADGLAVAWSSDLDGVLGGSPASSAGEVALAAAGLSAGTHVLTLAVADELGATCTDLLVLSVSTRPDVSIDAPAEGDVVNEGDTLSLRGTTADPEDPPATLEVAWTSDLDGTLDTTPPDAAGGLDVAVNGLTRGEHVLTLTVTDSAGLAASDAVRVRVNGLPGAPTVSISPASPATDDDLTATVDVPAVDPEGDPLTYQWDWYVDNVWYGTSSASLPASATRRGETWEVVVTPLDGWGAGSPGRASVTIVDTAPELVDVTLTPDVVATDGTLTCAASATDLDGDAVTLTYQWNTSSASFESASSVSAARFAPGDLVWCTVTPTATGVDGTSADSNVAAVNVAPTVSAAITPSPAYTGDLVSCDTLRFDSDGDALTVTYAWTRDGLAAGTTGTLSAGARGEVLACEATVSDGLDEASATGSIVVSNAVPVLTTITVSPGSPDTDDVLTASASTSDRDGDAVTTTFVWEVDGVAVGAGPNLAGSAFARGDVVVVVGTPDDGIDLGASVASDPVVIANSAPTAPTVTVNPGTATEGGEDLRCEVLDAATDADGDTLTYTITWTVDGSSWGGSTATTTIEGDTIPGDETTEGVWACTVEADDGTDAGPTASASALVTAGDTLWVDVAAGGMASCAVDSDAQLTCWGSDSYIGLVPGGDWLTVEVGMYEGCGIHTDGSLECWGGLSYVAGPPSGTFTDVDLHLYHACAVEDSGAIRCWGEEGGSRDFGQIVDGPHTDYVDVGTGSYNSCGVRAGGAVECWGRETAAEPSSGGYVTTSGGLGFNCALGSDGDVDCWGGTNVAESDAPTSGVAMLSSRYMHACALLTSGAIDCFGTPQNEYDQEVDPSGTDYVDVSAGGWHTLALDSAGVITGWGLDDWGQVSEAP